MWTGVSVNGGCRSGAGRAESQSSEIRGFRLGRWCFLSVLGRSNPPSLRNAPCIYTGLYIQSFIDLQP